MERGKPTTSATIIDEEKSKPTSNSPKATITTTTAQSNSIHQRRRVHQNCLLIWLAAHTDQLEDDRQNTLNQVRDVVNDINIFTQPDECVDFLTDISDTKVFLILEDSSSQDIVPLIHDIPQLNVIYMFCNNSSPHEQWTKDWTKIRGIHMVIKPICEALKMAVKRCSQDSIAVSFVTASQATSGQNLNQLEPSFMYTQIFKEILLEMTYDEKSIKDFISFWCQDCNNNALTLNIIAEFERDYCPQSSIRWYTREPFVYQMLNQALRTLKGDTIIDMGFFIHDLHEQIEQLYREQFGTYHGKSFEVYRGQGLLKTDFEKLVTAKGGLMSFNNFLSTSRDRDISLIFAESASEETDRVGILFKMTIDPCISSAPFASIGDISIFQTEEEILFSMHTVFRVDEITKINNNNLLYQVDLKLTADDDQQLRALTEYIGKEVVGTTGWRRLGNLLLRLSQFDKAEELYNVLLEKTSDEDQKAHYYNQLGYIRTVQGDYEKAIEYYKKGHKIKEKILPPNHLDMAISFINIGGVFDHMGDYSKALSCYEEAHEILEKILPSNDPLLGTSYNNIASAYKNMEQYLKALLFYEKGMEIREKTLPRNHPDLGTSYNNIGLVYNNMAEYSKALSFYEKALEIFEKALPVNHPLLATACNNIAGVFKNMEVYSKALLFYQRALNIFQTSLPSNHPSTKTVQRNIELLKKIM